MTQTRADAVVHLFLLYKERPCNVMLCANTPLVFHNRAHAASARATRRFCSPGRAREITG